jgi:hypothetical protein
MIVDPLIAEAVLSARILKLCTARQAAQYRLGPVKDSIWDQIVGSWEWHFSLSTLDLKRAAADVGQVLSPQEK